MGKILTAITIFAAILAAMMLSAGCNNEGCTDNQSSIPLAGFYSSANGNPIKVDSIQIGGVGAPADSMLVSSSRGVSEVYLPLRATHTSSSFYIRYTQQELVELTSLYDTISFDYEAIPYFASEDCGAMYRYRVQKCQATAHLIDSVVLVDSLITNANRESLRIYFRTQESGQK